MKMLQLKEKMLEVYLEGISDSFMDMLDNINTEGFVQLAEQLNVAIPLSGDIVRQLASKDCPYCYGNGLVIQTTSVPFGETWVDFDDSELCECVPL